MGLKLKYLSLNLLLLYWILGKTTNWIDIYSISLVYVYMFILKGQWVGMEAVQLHIISLPVK